MALKNEVLYTWSHPWFVVGMRSNHFKSEEKINCRVHFNSESKDTVRNRYLSPTFEDDEDANSATGIQSWDFPGLPLVMVIGLSGVQFKE